MAGKDWNNLGQDLNRIIEDAIHMGDFGRLSENIRGAFGRAFPGMGAGTGSFGGDGDWDFNLSGRKKQEEYHNSSETYERSSAKTNKNSYFMTDKKSPYFAAKIKRYGSGAGFVAGGAVLALLSFMPLAMLLVGTLISNDSIMTVMPIFMIVCIAAGIVLMIKGSKIIRLSRRFDRYVRILNGRTYTDIDTLASYSHMTEEKVRRNLRKMLKKGWFIQGHMDSGGTCLMVSNESYAQYLKAVKSMEQRQEEEKRQREEKAGRAGMTEEAREILTKGKEYIVKIRRSNDAILGEEISAKIYRMELLVTRIFKQAEEHPETIPELRKLMEYYLPMTVKLLDAYEELDGQPVDGENILNSKREIEEALDTLNAAFEKLLDNLFRDRAWDVSADISVLQTMLAQEGLTENDFKRK